MDDARRVQAGLLGNLPKTKPGPFEARTSSGVVRTEPASNRHAMAARPFYPGLIKRERSATIAAGL